MNFDEFFLKLENPQVFSGQEINAVRKEFSRERLNICLVFPDTYEIGMSHSGIKILYHLLNRLDGVHAQRSFLPSRPNIDVFRNNGVPLFSLENKTPLGEFDLIGFSLMSELNFTNIPLALELAGIPLYSRQRDAFQPIIGAGGIAVSNPEPLRDFIDFFAFGDGEVIFPQVVDVLRRGKAGNRPRGDVLKALDSIEGIYIPALVPLKRQGMYLIPQPQKAKVRKSVLRDLNRFDDERREIVPLTNVVFNRLNVEIARGCLQACRFCQARNYYAPFRVKSLKRNMEHIVETVRQTGFESFSLSSLSSGDYPYLADMLALIPRVIQPDVSFSVPSLRPSTLTDFILSTLNLFRRTGITIVPEAGSERLRQKINKDVTDQEIFNAVEMAIRHRWQRIKMYFMIGLPGETDGDIQAIVRLVGRIMARVRENRQSIRIHISFSSFVPKPHTPFQWAGREGISSLLSKIEMLKAGLKKFRNIELDFHSPYRGIVETLLARGDARMGEVILKAYRKGEIFSAWDSDFHSEVWEDLIADSGAREWLGELPLDAPLPWDFIELGMTKEHLREEYEKSLSAVPTPACRVNDCADCGGCFFGKSPYPSPEKSGIGESSVRSPGLFRKVRLYYEKYGDFRYLSHLSLMQYVERLLRRADLRFDHSGGFHPRIKMASLPPLPVHARGEIEVVELWVASDLDEAGLLRILQAQTDGFRFQSVKFADGRPSLGKDLHVMEYDFLEPDAGKIDEVKPLLIGSDEVSYSPGVLHLKIDYSQQGQERFARIYRTLDPRREKTHQLVRTRVRFKNEI
jgi:radical SAM family uncharacterized protein